MHKQTAIEFVPIYSQPNSQMDLENRAKENWKPSYSLCQIADNDEEHVFFLNVGFYRLLDL